MKFLYTVHDLLFIMCVTKDDLAGGEGYKYSAGVEEDILAQELGPDRSKEKKHEILHYNNNLGSLQLMCL